MIDRAVPRLQTLQVQERRHQGQREKGSKCADAEWNLREALPDGNLRLTCAGLSRSPSPLWLNGRRQAFSAPVSISGPPGVACATRELEMATFGDKILQPLQVRS